jgi:ankyrin repeat protein
VQPTRKNALLLLGYIVFLVSRTAEKKPRQQDRAAVTIWEAASKGDLPAVQRFLNNSIDINVRDPNGKTALHFAAQSKNLQMVRFLIQRGADNNAKAFRNVTPLMLSLDMAWAHSDIALELVQAGADVSAADTNGDAALLIATTDEIGLRRFYLHGSKTDKIWMQNVGLT